LIKEIDTFNYHSAPSGKLFKYLAAGVPVIGIDIPGFGIIKEFNCGVLIKSLDPLTIKTAIEKIESNFDYYSFNCLRVAKEYSFDKTTRPFLEYLETV
jgi:glycosyltransferase involved in cell wall biosynthesis